MIKFDESFLRDVIKNEKYIPLGPYAKHKKREFKRAQLRSSLHSSCFSGYKKPSLWRNLPTPIKYFNEDIKDAFKQIEALADDKLIALLPEDLRDDFCSLYNPTDEEKKIIKAADKLSALIKCIEENAMGNREFADAERATRKALEAYNLPEVKVFLEEFIPSFSLTLDEQKN